MLKNPAPITGRKIRLAVVGCGRISEKHFEAIARHSADIELVAVCDSSREALEAAVARTGARGFLDLEDLVGKSDADAVVLCTPSGLHPAQAIAVARSGRHVITEKPMAESVAEADRMLRAARAKRRALACVFQKRFDPFVEKALSLVRSGRLGRLCRATMVFCDFRTQRYYDSNA